MLEDNIWGADINEIVSDSLRFKKKLNIGEEVYTSLRLKNRLFDAMDAGNGVAAGVGLAKSTVVASTFFAPSGILGAIGIGAAATPVGWAIAAGVVGAGLSVVLGQKVFRSSSPRVDVIPHFINTPLDVLALGLFDMMSFLALKVAAMDGDICEQEKAVIQRYFVQQWGYDQAFVIRAMDEVASQLDESTIKEAAEKLAKFKKENQDCNYEIMAKELVSFLREVSEADGELDEREEMAVERVERVFHEVGKFSLTKTAQSGVDAIKSGGQKGVGAISSGLGATGSAIKSAGSVVGGKLINVIPSKKS